MHALRLTFAVIVLVCAAPCPLLATGATDAAARSPAAFQARMRELEARSGGRLGVAVVDTGAQAVLAFRSEERFAMCSTFKVALVAAVLARVDAGQESLDRKISFGTADLERYAPVCRQRLPEGAMTVGDLCAAALEVSDNTAANLLLRSLGGPSVLTGFARRSGDNGATNDVAIVWPPNRSPVILAVYFSESRGSSEARDWVLSDVASAVTTEFHPGN